MREDESGLDRSAFQGVTAKPGVGPVITTVEQFPPGVILGECKSYEFFVQECRCDCGWPCVMCEGSRWFLEHYDGDYTPGSEALCAWVEGQRSVNTPDIDVLEQSPKPTSMGASAGGSERMAFVELDWEVLPLNERGWEILHAQHASTSKGRTASGRQIEIDHERLRRIRQFKPNICHIGRNEFDRYRVFAFLWTNRVVAECHWKGNAIYVVSGDWKNILRHTKAEMRTSFGEYITRVPHQGDWFAELNDALGYRRRPEQFRHLT